MDLVVDQAGQNEFTPRVHHLCSRRGRNRIIKAFDPAVFNEQILFLDGSLVYYLPSGNEEVAHRCDP